MWNYLYFLIYLDDKDKDEFTQLEEYVYEKRQSNDNSFFPVGRAICVENFTKE